MQGTAVTVVKIGEAADAVVEASVDVLDAVDEQLVEQLADRARSEGLRLTGEGGLLARLTKRVVESVPASASAVAALSAAAASSTAIAAVISHPRGRRRWHSGLPDRENVRTTAARTGTRCVRSASGGRRCRATRSANRSRLEVVMTARSRSGPAASDARRRAAAAAGTARRTSAGTPHGPPALGQHVAAAGRRGHPPPRRGLPRRHPTAATRRRSQRDGRRPAPLPAAHRASHGAAEGHARPLPPVCPSPGA